MKEDENIPMYLVRETVNNAIDVLTDLQDATSANWQTPTKLVIEFKDHDSAEDALSDFKRILSMYGRTQEEKEVPKPSYDPDDPERCTKLIRDLPTGLNYEDAR